MTAMGDVAFVVGIFLGPPLVLIACVLLRVARQPRWVLATALALSAVTALAWIAYWYLWGKAFEYADADTYAPVPAALDRASNIAIAVCFTGTMMLAALGASRLAAAWNSRHRSGSVLAT